MKHCEFDLESMPFSRRGSWINFSIPVLNQFQPLGPGLYMRSSHSRPVAIRELFKIELLDPVTKLPLELKYSATPSCLVLSDNRDSPLSEITFDGTKSVRIKGYNCILSLSSTLGGGTSSENATHFAAYTDSDNGIAVNFRAAIIRLQINALDGKAYLDTDWDVDNSTHANVEVHPNVEGNWELSIDEYTSTWKPQRTSLFEVAKEDCQHSFESFIANLPYAPQEWIHSQLQAAYCLWSCTMEPCGQLRRETVFMSLNWMDQLWSWDNCFNMAAIERLDDELAFDQLMIFADHQDEFGAYPDGLNDGFKHYNFSKPPVQSILLRWILERNPNFLNVNRKIDVYNTLSRLTEWWLENRRYDGNLLCHVYHGNDVGWDNGSLMAKGGPLIPPDLNAFIVDQCEFLSDLAEELGYEDEARIWVNTANSLSNAIIDELWIGDQFAAIFIPTGEKVTSHSHAGCLPALLGHSLPENIRSTLIDRISPLLTEHGFASESPNSPNYISNGYWRGPIWAPTTMLMVIGLERIGENELAQELALRFCKTCAINGFGENFEATTGEALRDRGYTWTASVFLELLHQYVISG